MNLQRFLRSCRIPRLQPQLGKKTYATRPKISPIQAFRVHPLPAALIGFSFVCLGAGLYNHLTSDIQLYPIPVRQPLLKALYYQQNNDLTLALKYFNEALTEAQGTELDKDALMGVMIQLGVLQESMDNAPDARRTYISALRHLLGCEGIVVDFDLESVSVLDQKKAISLAQRLGDITSGLQMDKEAEAWYTWSVNHLLKTSTRLEEEHPIFDQEHMPSWLTKTDFKVMLEKVGEFYTSRNKPDSAMALYMRGLDLIGLESCQSAVLINSLVESFARLGQYEDAKLWGQRGLDLAQNPNTGKMNNDSKVCDQACGVLLFNMGMLFEQTKDRSKAIQFYQSARKYGRDFKQADCIKEADRALRRIEFEIQRDNTQL